jgi:hypothetical protein
MSCQISDAVSGKASFFADLLLNCGIRVREFPGSEPKLYMYKKSGAFSGTPKVYSKMSGSLYDFFAEHLPDWELRGDAVSQVMLDGIWRDVTARGLEHELQSKYLVQANEETKQFYVLEPIEVTQHEAQLHYSLFYDFRLLNQDLYELVKSYVSEAELVKYSRDGRIYLKLIASTTTREALNKAFMVMKASFDDKSGKAQKLGTFFLKEERENLQLLYQLLSELKILAFYDTELSPVPVSVLNSLGLEMYQYLPSSSSAAFETLPIAPELLTPPTAPSITSNVTSLKNASMMPSVSSAQKANSSTVPRNSSPSSADSKKPVSNESTGTKPTRNPGERPSQSSGSLNTSSNSVNPNYIDLPIPNM